MTGSSESTKTTMKVESLWECSVRFYLEGISKTKKLLEIDVSDDLFFGRLSSFVEDAKYVLRDIENEDIITILDFGDCLISAMITNEIKVRDQDGIVINLTGDILDRVTHTDLLPLTLGSLGEVDFLVKKSTEDENPIHVSPVRFCAAFALAQASQAINSYGNREWFAEMGGYHAMQAAEAMTMAKLLDSDEQFIARLIARKQFSNRAREGSAAKLANDSDGKQAAKQNAFNQWVAWQNGAVTYKSGAAFARHIVETLPIENTKTVERWMQAWRKETKVGPR
jgi:hypothetical protein